MKTNKLIFLIFGAFCGLNVIGQQPPATWTSNASLLPVPAAVQFQAGRLSLAATFTVAVDGYRDVRLEAGIDRALRRLERRTGLELPRTLGAASAGATLVVQCQRPGQKIPSVAEDESYNLVVSDKQATLNALTVVGVLRGLETFLQLVDSDRSGFFLPAVRIQDKPRFSWRGLMIDVGRHFEPAEVIKRELDGMAAVKLNVLHWHLTEDQGFRVESREYPKLQKMGSDGLYYTQDEIREVVAYATERGIRVVPEFDMPAHSTSWLVGYPELASAPGPYQIERKWGIFDPAFDPTREEVYKLIDGFLGEMAALFPDAYMHIGGDETNGEQWKKNPRIQAFMKEKGLKDTAALQGYFTKRILAIVTRHGKKMIGWDEILSPDMPKNIVIQSWRGAESLAQGAKSGYEGILSNGYYLDLMYPASQHYMVDPVPANSGLTDQQKELIMGGEACMWSEYVSPETIDSRIWPRLGAVAERLWSPSTVNNVDDLYRRMAVLNVQLEELGLNNEVSYGKLLRNLVGSQDVGPLKTLIDTVEPVKEYNRGRFLPSTQFTPLIRLVDTARPESPMARPFGRLVDEFLSDAPHFHAYQGSLQRVLGQWRDVEPALNVMTDRSVVLHEAEPLARDLSEIGTTGLEAVSYLSAGVAPPTEWRTAKLALLARAAQPKAALEFGIIPSVKQLVLAATETGQLKTIGPEEWNKWIKSLSVQKSVATN